jgi:hypothetical protein
VDPRIGLEEIDDIGDELVDLPLIRARGEPGRVVHTGKLGDPDGFLAVSVPVVVLRASGFKSGRGSGRSISRWDVRYRP